MHEPKRKMASATSVFKIYWAHTIRYPWSLLALILSIVTILGAELMGPLYLRQFFNSLVAVHNPGSTSVDSLIAYIGLFGLAALVAWTGNRVRHFSVVRLETHIMSDLYQSSFDYLLQHSYHFFISNFAGSLTHRVNKYVRAYETLLDALSSTFIPAVLFISGAVVILYGHNHPLGIMLAIWSIAFLTFQILVARWRQPLRRVAAEEDTRVTGALADAISNHPTITLFSGLSNEKKRFGGVMHRWFKAIVRSWTADDWIWGALGLFMIVIQVGLLYGAVLFWQRSLLTVGDFVLIQVYLLSAFERLMSLNRELRRFYDAFANASEMVAILETPHEIQDAQDAKPLLVTSGEITFNNINFYFHKEAAVLKDLNVRIRGAERVALVGPSGAGKSTITKLLLRFYDITEGTIEIDEQNIAKVTQESLRDAVGFVPQDPILFHRSLMENIRYGKRGASDAEVIEAAKRAHCHEFISSLPHRYDTYVGERGVKLSGGERQRVAIARALLKNAPILVLDEATSSLDSESEALIQDALQILMKDKTVVVIAHRLSTIMQMDRIIVIEGGKVIAQGSHDSLLQERGLYHKLWSIQAGGFLLEGENEGSKPEEEPEDIAEALQEEK